MGAIMVALRSRRKSYGGNDPLPCWVARNGWGHPIERPSAPLLNARWLYWSGHQWRRGAPDDSAKAPGTRPRLAAYCRRSRSRGRRRLLVAVRSPRGALVHDAKQPHTSRSLAAQLRHASLLAVYEFPMTIGRYSIRSYRNDDARCCSNTEDSILRRFMCPRQA